MSVHTKTFIILIGIIIFGTFIAIGLSKYLPNSDYKVIHSPAVKNSPPTQESVVLSVDTSNWKIYKNNDFGFSFDYKPDWKILPETKKGDFTVIEIDPGRKFYNIQIFVSKKGFYVMDGLPIKTENINGKTFQNVKNLLYGTVNQPFYLTLDIGKSLSLLPNFYALVHSLTFE